MPTEKRRINVTLTREVDKALTYLSKRERLPQAAIALALLKSAMEIEEDAVWDKVAARRDRPRARFVSHTRAWK